MSMANALLNVVRGQQPLSALPLPLRAHQHMSVIMADTLMPSRGAPAHVDFERALQAGDPALNVTDFIETLWNAKCNQDLVQEFMNISLCFDAAQGNPKALAAYKDYAAQDFFYLSNYITFKVLRQLTAPVNHSFAAEDAYVKAVGNDTEYASTWLGYCKNNMSIPMENVTANTAVLDYTSYLNKVAQSDNWFSLHVVLIACNYGWSKLALSLYKEDMNKTTDFYKFWLKDSLNLTNPAKPALSSYALKLNTFLSQNAPLYPSRLQAEDTNKLFRAGLILEINLFNSVYKRDG